MTGLTELYFPLSFPQSLSEILETTEARLLLLLTVAGSSIELRRVETHHAAKLLARLLLAEHHTVGVTALTSKVSH
jgi:hypothetical protein